MLFHRARFQHRDYFLVQLGAIPSVSLSPLETQAPQKQEVKSHDQWKHSASHCKQNQAIMPVSLVSVKWLIIPLGWVVNENSNSSSLFQLGGEMGDAIRYLCCSLFRSVYLEGLQNSGSLSTGRAKIIAKKKNYFLNLLLSESPPKTDINILPSPSDSVQIFFCFFWALLFPLHL